MSSVTLPPITLSICIHSYAIILIKMIIFLLALVLVKLLVL